ncbi:prenyltransferase/squalene oxidase repeat-containing protein [Gimesia maris]|uniref:Squalene cyclase C-terminal domain-containing protein n=1 Tax=Gimesia maris TaxID=122 RepID=A0ABX5YKH8_9PLAN|nr:hypothetical protein [Gimesia maris]EDL56854.1 hypothetical protein PM8797T_01724 [Gimesia maris DSM 8797]QEG16209.1 hypothetical protein GmarT_20710 [Gimesia maris]QGQ30576.1 hypothetical protein F1729_19015 [Gimesia maris]
MYRHCNHNRVCLLGILLLIPGQLNAEDLTPDIRVERGKFKSRQQQVSNALLKGRRWLEQQQKYDGSWQSKTYASFESRIADSALVMSTLVEITPPGAAQGESISRGLAFLKSKINQEEIWKSVEAESNYPMYSICLMLATLNQYQPEATVNRELRDSLSRELLRRQRILQADRLSEGDVAGGWGPGSDSFQQGSAANPPNVSVTYFALAALSGAQKLPLKNRFAALDYLQHCQVPAEAAGAGGFVFTFLSDHPLNKAGSQRSPSGKLYGVPYLSATCDGISALLVCDVPADDRRIQTAIHVLPQLTHARLAVIPLSAEFLPSYQKLDALFFYEAAATARVWKQMREKGVENQFLNSRCHEVLQTLIAKQQADGHWENPLPWMMEDDPLIATAFALQTLHHCLTPAE